jgi:excisionase family DNA binding protein
VTGALLTAAELADRLGVSRPYVYEHAAELGAIRLGDGPKARLRFDLHRTLDRLAATEAAAPSNPSRTTARPRTRAGAATALLPIRGPMSHAEGARRP